MATPLLATKLFRPRRRPGAVARPALLARLDEGLDTRLTIIAAPAGFGKTALLAEWIARRNHRFAWVSLDDEHTVPGRLLAYLVGAIRSVEDAFCDELAATLDGPLPVSIRGALTAFINALVAVPEHLVILLDDYHLADTDENAEMFQFLLEHLPPTVHVVTSSRTRPRLPLARLRARGQLVEIGMHDLRFTVEEAGEFLRNVMGLDVGTDDAAVLTQWTEGWPAGIQLAGLAMRRRDGPLDIIGSLTESNQQMVDFLVQEVVDQQPIGVRSFLERTSILERMRGSLCDAMLMTPPGTSQTHLEKLEHDNVFLVPLDGERTWYRYHHLFGNLLRRRLESKRGAPGEPEPQSIDELHGRASRWYEDHGDGVEAFKHAAAGGNLQRASELIGRGTPLPYRGAAAPVFEWLRSLPQEALAESPMLGVWLGLASVLLGRTEDVEPTLAAAEATLATAPGTDSRSDALGHLATVRALLAVATGDPKRMSSQARHALEHLPATDAAAARSAARFALGLAKQLEGDAPAALREYDAILADAAEDDLVFRVAAAVCRGQVEEDRGSLRAASTNFEHAIELAGSPPLPYACEGYLGLARIHYDWNDLDRAEALAADAIRLGSLLTSVDTPAAGHEILARIALARSEVASAAEHVAQAKRLAAARQPIQLDATMASVRVRLAMAQDDRTEIASLLEQPMTALLAARVRLANRQAGDALAALERQDEASVRPRSLRERLEELVVRALAHAALGDDELALIALRDAMTQAESGGYVRVFVDEGAAIHPLVARVRRGMTIRPKVLEALDEDRRAAGRRSTTARRSHDALVEPLSEAEFEVLRLIAEGHSNKEIARRLFRAVSTIKGHNRTLFAKLHVRNRTEAVARARRLELL